LEEDHSRPTATSPEFAFPGRRAWGAPLIRDRPKRRRITIPGLQRSTIALRCARENSH